MRFCGVPRIEQGSRTAGSLLLRRDLQTSKFPVQPGRTLRFPKLYLLAVPVKLELGQWAGSVLWSRTQLCKIQVRHLFVIACRLHGRC